MLKDKIINRLNTTATYQEYYEHPIHRNRTGANCVRIDDGIILKTWCNGCLTVFVFKDNVEIGSIDNFYTEFIKLSRQAEDRVKQSIIAAL